MCRQVQRSVASGELDTPQITTIFLTTFTFLLSLIIFSGGCPKTIRDISVTSQREQALMKDFIDTNDLLFIA